MMMDRVILHCDCNSFFASVELVELPHLKNCPVAVCGSEQERHGIVLAKNEIAKRYGIFTTQTVADARRVCPNLVIIPPHYEKYAAYSRAVREIFERYTDQIEPFGMDEAWLDVTASQKLFGSGEQIAHSIREQIKSELSITVSIGVSFNKVFAKLGSDYKKPDATTVISRENFKEIVYPLPASDLLFVGKKTAETLLSMGVRTIGQLATLSESVLTNKFGKGGELLYKYSRGLDDSPVSTEREEAKSVGNGFTFRHDLVKPEECRVGIDFLSDEIGRRLRAKGMKCATVQLTIKDEFLHSIQRQRSQNPPSDIAREISDTAYKILLDEWSDTRPIRMITVTATNLVHRDEVTEQIDMFAPVAHEDRDKLKKREETIDKIRQKFGTAAITQGSIIESDIGIFEKIEDK